MSTPIWEQHSNGQLVTTAQAVDLVAQHSDRPISPATWRSYQRHWGEKGLIPVKKTKVGNVALYDAGEVIHWAQNRLGRGTKAHLAEPPTPQDSSPSQGK